MAVRVTSAASDRKLCTLSEVKLRLGIRGEGAADDERLDGLIVAVSATIESFLGRPLARQTYQEGISGTGRRRILLSRYPVDANSTSLTISGDAQTDYTVEAAEIGQLWREGGWTENAAVAGQDGEANVVVTYKAGYVLPNWISTFEISKTYSVGDWVRSASPVKDLLFEVTAGGLSATAAPTWPTTAGLTVVSNAATFTARHALELPMDIREAAILGVATWFRGGLDVPAIVERESLGPVSVSYRELSGNAHALPAASVALLEPHR